MFLPYFIALFLGFVSPSNNSNCHTNTSVVSTNDAGDEDGGSPDDDGTGGTGTGTGGGTGSGTGTGGDTGNTPPPKP